MGHLCYSTVLFSTQLSTIMFFIANPFNLNLTIKSLRGLYIKSVLFGREYIAKLVKMNSNGFGLCRVLTVHVLLQIALFCCIPLLAAAFARFPHGSFIKLYETKFYLNFLLFWEE